MLSPSCVIINSDNGNMKLSHVTTFALAFFIVGCQQQTQPAPAEKQDAAMATPAPTPAPMPAPAPPIPAVIQAYDGPFGLKMGLSKEQIEAMGVQLTDRKEGVYSAEKLVKTHSVFEIYLLTIGEKEGLCRIMGVGKTIETGSFGTALQDEFNSLEKQLKDVYGKNSRYDFVRKGSIWKEPEDWMMGLLKTERTLTAMWLPKEGSVMKESISGIVLDTMALSNTSGRVSLNYLFSNSEECSESIKAEEKSAL